ncbi:MAG: hypothetical protein L0K38_06335, partial [Yaniella sp.]|uniref:hypothetical protein n=1 Tax=Yaniella sp. TaxID=2773929 RepID=UPI00264916E5
PVTAKNRIHCEGHTCRRTGIDISKKDVQDVACHQLLDLEMLSYPYRYIFDINLVGNHFFNKIRSIVLVNIDRRSIQTERYLCTYPRGSFVAVKNG